jgi:signal transduction histidine kinase
LAALIGYLEIIKPQLSATAQRDVLQRSLVEAGRIDLLVRELLDFSRPSDDLYEKLDPAMLLSATVELLRHQGVFKRLTLDDQLPVSLPQVSGSRHKLQQTYINLLLNAAQACAEGGRIILSAGCQEESVWIKVTDNGCGIKEDDCGKIFDPFFTTKEPGKGTGLGLAICHRAMEEFGGRIEMKSIVAEGSEFTIHLPIDREAVNG